MFFQQQFMVHLNCVGKYFQQHPQCLLNRTHRHNNFKMRPPVVVNKLQVDQITSRPICLKSFTHYTKFYQFFMAMCFSCNCKASSSLLWKLIQENFVLHKKGICPFTLKIYFRCIKLLKCV
jgi:hypothetical protein